MEALISHASEDFNTAVEIEKFFVREALDLAKIRHMKYDAAKHDLALISYYKEKNRNL